MTSFCSTGRKDLDNVGKPSAVEFKEDQKIDEIQFGMAGIFLNKGTSLTDNEMLANGQMLVSGSNKFCAIMQGDGNFVIYKGYKGPTWASNTDGVGTSPFQLRMQADGNLVVYGDGKATWASGTDGKGTGPFKLTMQNDGNLVIYEANGQPTWASNTMETLTDNLGQDSALTDNQFLESNSGQFQVVMQTDGNFVLYELQYGGVRNPLWASNTNNKGTGPFKVTMQSDGNLVLYDIEGTATWASNTSGKGSKPFKLTMQDDGNLVIYDGEQIPTWATGTNRICQCVLAQGRSLRSNQFLTSKNHTCTAAMQSDGNFCIYFGGLYCVWASNTCGKGSGPFELRMQDNGNLVIYDRTGEATWASGTVMTGVISAKMQDDGNLVLYMNLHDPIWATNTDLLKID